MVFGKLCFWSKAESFACVSADFILVFNKIKDAPNPDVLWLFCMDVEDITSVISNLAGITKIVCLVEASSFETVAL